MNKYFSKTEALAALKESGFVVLWSKAESDERGSFVVVETPDELMSLLRQSI